MANFFWLLVEALYLNSLLLSSFCHTRRCLWGFSLLGWGENWRLRLNLFSRYCGGHVIENDVCFHPCRRTGALHRCVDWIQAVL